MTEIGFTKIDFPEVDLNTAPPEIPTEYYQSRLELVREIMAERGLDYLVIYGDREHFATLHYMTGYDPRFEESILIISPEKKPVLLVGNEGLGYKEIAKLPVEIVLYQTFSLMGQPREESPSLEKIIKDTGIISGSKVGLVGTKYFTADEVNDPEHTVDVPGFITDAFRAAAGYDNVTNETDIFVHPEKGLRTYLSAEEIALFEYSALIVYDGVKNLYQGLKEGITEYQAASLFNFAGFPPLSCHITLGFGDNALLGLGSPSPVKKLEIGDYVNFGFGVWGANIARAGLAVTSEDQLTGETAAVLEELYFPYFKMIKDWYESLQVGETGGKVYNVVSEFVEDEKYGVELNPGHLIHREEWVHSPFSKGSEDILHSGLAVQCDIISAPGAPLYGTHVEDGLVLADAELRQEIKNKFPETAARFEKRREFMRQRLGINVSEDVLPMSNIQAALSPFLLKPEVVLSFN